MNQQNRNRIEGFTIQDGMSSRNSGENKLVTEMDLHLTYNYLDIKTPEGKDWFDYLCEIKTKIRSIPHAKLTKACDMIGTADVNEIIKCIYNV